jgi:hypothetical protein
MQAQETPPSQSSIVESLTDGHCYTELIVYLFDLLCPLLQRRKKPALNFGGVERRSGRALIISQSGLVAHLTDDQGLPRALNPTS